MGTQGKRLMNKENRVLAQRLMVDRDEGKATFASCEPLGIDPQCSGCSSIQHAYIARQHSHHLFLRRGHHKNTRHSTLLADQERRSLPHCPLLCHLLVLKMLRVTECGNTSVPLDYQIVCVFDMLLKRGREQGAKKGMSDSVFSVSRVHNTRIRG